MSEILIGKKNIWKREKKLNEEKFSKDILELIIEKAEKCQLACTKLLFTFSSKEKKISENLFLTAEWREVHKRVKFNHRRGEKNSLEVKEKKSLSI